MQRLAEWLQEVLVPALGPLGLFVVAFVDSSFFSFPEINDVLVVSSSAARPTLAWLFVAMTTGGSLAGSSLLWYLGRQGGKAVLVRRFGRQRADHTLAAFQRFGVLALAVPALLPPPLPYRVFVLAAGVLGLDFRRFILTLLACRTARYTFWGVLGALYRSEAVGFLGVVDLWFADHGLWLLAALSLLLGFLLVQIVRRSRGVEG